jgi:hypothetical protein
MTTRLIRLTGHIAGRSGPASGVGIFAATIRRDHLALA